MSLCRCRYGGPGRLKKACIKRLCVVISQMISSELAPEEKQVSRSDPQFENCQKKLLWKKQVLHSVPVTPVKPAVKTEPQVFKYNISLKNKNNVIRSTTKHDRNTFLECIFLVQRHAY